MSKPRDAGFTLVELLVTITMLAMVMGMAYTSFSHALTVYREDATQLTLARDLRKGLSGLTRDMTNIMADAEDENLQLMFEDIQGIAEGQGQDIISFVATVQPNTEASSASGVGEPPSLRAITGSSPEDEEAQSQASSDLVRVLYFIGPNPDTVLNPALILDEADAEATALVRVTTGTLGLEAAFGEVLGQDPSTMITILAEQGASIESVVDHAVALDFAFFDGEEWWPQWDVEEQGVPAAVRALLTVQDPSDELVTYTRSATARLAVTSAPETAAAGGGGGQQGGGGGPQPGG